VRPIVKDNIAVFSPQGFIDSNNCSTFIDYADLDFAISNNVEAILISMKKVIFFNKNGINFFITTLEKAKTKSDIEVGFCDVDEKKYKLILDMFENEDLPADLFKTYDIARLFTGLSDVKAGANILVWNEDSTQKNNIVVSLVERGYTAIAAKDEDDFKKKKKSKEAGFEVIVDNVYFGSHKNRIAAHQMGNSIIYSFSGFLDAGNIGSFDYTYHSNCLNVGFLMFVFDFEQVLSMNVYGVNFFKKLAKISFNYGAIIAIAGLNKTKVSEELLYDLEESGVKFFASLKAFLEDPNIKEYTKNNTVAVARKKRTITKGLVEKTGVFIDACVYSVGVLTNKEAQKQRADVLELKIKDLPVQEDIVASSIGFYGQLEGMLVLLFKKDIAKIACNMFLGEEDPDDDTIKDALSEFINIIGGKAKTVLTNAGMVVNMTLPKSFDSLEEVEEALEEKKGVYVELDFAGSPFYFYLTR
jgi:CheY-specific phosphatase CheX/anti-anti-sigma regulatory factor